MGIMKQFSDAWDTQDKETVDNLLDPDCVVWSHTNNKGFTKEEFMAWMSPDFPKSEKFRVIYKNEEIGVTHEFLSFQSGKEAVLCAWSIKNGKIIRIETGATPISS